MVPVKILCGCGQKYSFDVEPVNGQMPWVVQCPVCGADGTSAANITIAQSISVAQPAMALPVASPVRVAMAAPPAAAPVARVSAPPPSAPAPSQRPKRLPGQLEPEQALIEARAKVSWGDTPQQVLSYLMIQGFSRAEADGLVNEMFAERASTVRKNGIGKMMVGTGMLFVPVVTYVVLMSMGMSFTNPFFPVKLFAFAAMVGLWGAYKVIKGIFMLLSPRSEAGDVAAH